MKTDNIPSHSSSGIATEKAVEIEKAQAELAKNRIYRILYLIGGVLALGLGIFGLFIPGLPTTPLVLLAAALLAKSNRRLYDWLLNNKVLGPRIRNYQRRQGVTMQGKYKIIAFMSAMVLFSSFVIIQIWSVRIIVLTAGVIGGIVVRFFVPTAKDEESDARSPDKQ